MFDTIVDTLAVVCVLGAALLSIAAGIGLLRFRDPLSRLHAATKPQILGLMLIVIAVALEQRSWAVFFALIPVMILQMITAPISAHMIGRAAYRFDHIDRDRLGIDELDAVIQEASAEDRDWRVGERGTRE